MNEGPIEYDPYSYEVHEDPYPTYRRLRDEAPLYHNERVGFWALSRHSDVVAALKDTRRFSNCQGVALETMGGYDASATMSFLAMDPPKHTRMRALVSHAFTPRRVAAFEPRIRQIATEHIDAVIDRRSCDFIGDFAGKLPMDVVSEMFGVPPEDRALLRSWSEGIVHREEGQAGVPASAVEAAVNLLRYLADMTRHAKNAERDDLTGALLQASLDGDRLSDREVVGILFLMVIAGNETTTNLLGSALYWLWKHTDQRARVRSDPGLIAGWVEETLRFDGSTQGLARTAVEDIGLHGGTMPAGSRVLLLLGSANRDERVWTDPDRFDVSRDTTLAVSFGHGIHYCLGAPLARLEANVALQEVQARLPDFEIDERRLVRVHSSNVRGFSQVLIGF
jgi:cytochrome P450